jgi:glycosyltransferase involved in cell wall biosynthesis
LKNIVRIAFLDSWIQSSAEGSGTAVGLGGLVGALRAQGHLVDRIAPVGPRPRNLTLRRLRFNLQLFARWRAQPYDLVVGTDIDGVFWSSRHGDVPYIVAIKGVIAEELQHERGRTRRLFHLLARLEARNARHADVVLADSAYCQDAIVRHYGIPADRIRLVPEGIDLARWQRIAAQTPHLGDGSTILCVARQYPRKHVADLLRAMPQVRRDVPSAHAVIIGNGPEHASLRALAAELGLGDAVQFLGAIADDDEVARWYRCADVFCLPSVQEAFGIVFLEAMASGLPVVATRAAAIPEVVPDGQAGLLVPPGDVDALAAALTVLLREPARRAAYGAHGQARARRYDWSLVAEQFLAQVTPFAIASPRPQRQSWKGGAGRGQ